MDNQRSKKQIFILMAHYNQWMNHQLYTRCSNLTEPQLKQDRGAFFSSIFSTLNHIIYADLAFLSRFTGDPAQVPEVGMDLFQDFQHMFQFRESLDARIIQWVTQLDEQWLHENQTYTSKIDQKQRTVTRWILLQHIFNHQTHHRGQLTTLLSQIGIDFGTTDLPFMPDLEHFITC